MPKIIFRVLTPPAKESTSNCVLSPSSATKIIINEIRNGYKYSNIMPPKLSIIFYLIICSEIYLRTVRQGGRAYLPHYNKITLQTQQFSDFN